MPVVSVNGRKDEKHRVTTPISPLSPLRLSAPVFEIEEPKEGSDLNGVKHGKTIKNQSHHKHHTKQSSNKEPSTKESPNRHTHHPTQTFNQTSNQTSNQEPHILEPLSTSKPKDGFLLDLNLPHVSSSTQETEEPINTVQVKKIRELASIYLNTRKSLRADFNIIDPIKPNDVSKDSESKTIQISQKTLSRAEKVKISLSLKYLFLQRLAENEAVDHPGVEGRYNPLQILRNRKIREKYNEHPKQISIKPLPLACNVFSSNNVSGKKPWKMLWAIELDELINDSSWRKAHWNELRDSKGNLWFPPPQTRPSLQDMLFDESTEKSSSVMYNGKANKLTSSSTSTDSEHLFKISSTKTASRRLKDKMKRKSKKHYNGSSSNNNSESDNAEEEVYPQRDLLKDQFFKRITPPCEDRLNDVEEVTINSSEQDLQPAPQFKHSDNSSSKELDINDVSFKPLEKKNFLVGSGVELLDLGQKAVEERIEEADSLISLQEQCDLATRELKVICSNYSYFDNTIKLKIDYLLQVYPKITRQIDTKLHDLMNNQMNDIFLLTVSINDEFLPASEEIYNGFLNEIRSIIHVINNEYSIKIDNLLSGCDRSIGEISTSLSLELRKVNEKLDKLNTSMFRNNVVADSIKNGEFTMKFKDSYNYKFLYFCLENLIVILLRFVWVIVNFYKLCASLVKMVWCLIRYLLF